MWEMIGLGVLVILGILAVPTLIALILYKQITAFGRPDLELIPADRSKFAAAVADAKTHDPWFVSRGFDIVACSTLSTMNNVLVSAWQHRERPTYICIYHVANQRNYDIVTRMNNDILLTTGSTKDGLLLPNPPGGYTQCFPEKSLSDMWEFHTEAEQYLFDEGATLAAGGESFEEVFVEALHREADFVRTIPFWPFRGAYWYFVRRGKLSGKAVRQLVAEGVYARPSEILLG